MARIRKFKPPKILTVIGQGTSIKGDIGFSGGLHLDGKIRGNVTGEPDTLATLIVSEHGEIEGEVRTDNLIVNGTIKGDVHAVERLEIADNARITGNVYYRLLEMAMGAEINGQLFHRENKEPQRLCYDGHRAEREQVVPTVAAKEQEPSIPIDDPPPFEDEHPPLFADKDAPFMVEEEEDFGARFRARR